MKRAFWALSLAAAITTTTGQAQTPAKTMLWAVRGAEGPPIYIGGSVHVLSKEFYPLSETWNNAFASSSVLIEEVDLAEMEDPVVAMGLLSRGMLADGKTLRDVIPADLHKEVSARAAKLGLPEIAIDRMKPWVVAVTLTTPQLRDAGFDPALGVDRHFFDLARTQGKQRRALETASFQIDRLDQLSPPMQTAMLKSALDDVDSEAENLQTIATAWSTGNVVTLERLLLASLMESPELYERLLVERNRNWVAPVEQCLRDKTSCFVVVGAAHLVGPHSLVAMLRDKGYKVEQQ